MSRYISLLSTASSDVSRGPKSAQSSMAFFKLGFACSDASGTNEKFRRGQSSVASQLVSR
jgi:hypothetical protein